MPNLLSRPRLRGARPGALDAALGPEESAPEVIASGDVRWLNLERPREADRDWLEQEFGFHPLAIEDVASRNQRPKLDAYDDYLFIVLHFPVFARVRYDPPMRTGVPPSAEHAAATAASRSTSRHARRVARRPRG